MKKLTDQAYWDSIYNKSGNSHFKGVLLNKLKHLMRNYANYLIWEKIFPKYFVALEDKKVIEIGCAPGKNLISFSKIFHLKPYGVEYSAPGVKLTKETFKSNNLPEENIIEADFFNDQFILKFSRTFDIVYSKGFIEHFDNPKQVVARHGKLLKEDGLLIIQIPNLSGLNFYLSRFFNIESHNLHNLSIMNYSSFKNLFSPVEYDILYCNYVGAFNIGLFNTKSTFKKRLHLLIYYLIQQPINFIFRVISHVYKFESRFTSPYLLMIAKIK